MQVWSSRIIDCCDGVREFWRRVVDVIYKCVEIVRR